jgi:hypothetical protein
MEEGGNDMRTELWSSKNLKRREHLGVVREGIDWVRSMAGFS